jgi:hypothetical protein
MGRVIVEGHESVALVEFNGAGEERRDPELAHEAAHEIVALEDIHFICVELPNVHRLSGDHFACLNCQVFSSSRAAQSPSLFQTDDFRPQ